MVLSTGNWASLIRRSVARFAPTELTADLSGLTPGDRTALTHLVKAAQVMAPPMMGRPAAGV
jgi:hypothetical protein